MMANSEPEALLNDVPTEAFDVFEVKQLTRGTALHAEVAADWVAIGPGKTSQVHRHNHAETVIWVAEGRGTFLVGDERLAVRAGSRIAIGKGVFHGVITEESALTFLSIQSPPILDHDRGTLDLEMRP